MRRLDGIALYALVALLFLTAPCRGASDPQATIRSSADRTIVRIGDAITYRVTVEYDSTLALVTLSPEAVLADFEIRSRRSDAGEARPGYRAVSEEIVLACWSPGVHEIGARPYLLRSAGGEVDTLTAAAIPVEVVSTLPEDAEDILDIKAPAVIPKKFPVAWIVGGAVLVVALAVALIWWIRRRRRRPVTMELPPPRPAHEIAYEALDELRGQSLPGSGQGKAYYIALSEIVRRYLGARFGVPSMDRTTTELLVLLRGSECGRDSMGAVREVLGESDGAKFARWEGTLEEAEESMKRAYRVVDETRAASPVGAAAAAPRKRAGVASAGGQDG